MAISQKPTRKSINLPDSTFVLDNGAYTIKAGFASTTDCATDAEHLQNCEVVPNSLVRSRDKKTYIAAQQHQITQWSEAIFRRPIENGQLVSWEVQKEIWDYSFFEQKTAREKCFVADLAETTLLLTEQPNSMPALQRNTDEIVMEEYGFGGYARCIGPTLNAFHDYDRIFRPQTHEAGTAGHDKSSSPSYSPIECLLVVDCGYSSTTITPCFNGKPIQRAIRRMDFGGKHLTNLLKEIISVRHFDLSQDTKVVNDIKEDVCFVSQDLKADMEKTWKGNRTSSTQSRTSRQEQDGSSMELDQTHIIDVDYILPDGVSLLRGFSRPHDPSSLPTAKTKTKIARQHTLFSTSPAEILMTLTNERFLPPELLFTPSTTGSRHPGLADCIVQSLSTLPPLLQATMLANVIVVGGTATLPGFRGRLEDELRARTRSEWTVKVCRVDIPDGSLSSWLGGVRLATNHGDELRARAVSKAEYEEYGAGWLARRFSRV